MTYLIAYLLLGLPVAIINTIALRGKWYLALFSWPVWPFWSAVVIEVQLSLIRAKRCGYCREVIKGNEAAVFAHVQSCDKNPLVLRVRVLRRALRHIASGKPQPCGVESFAETVLDEDEP